MTAELQEEIGVADTAPVVDAAPTELTPPDESFAEPVDGPASSPGQPRGPDGKFAPKTAPAGPLATPEAATDPAAPLAAIQAPDAATEPLTAPVETPWSMKVDGQTFGLEGAVFIPGKGILFPEAHAGIVHKYIARGIQYEQERPALRAQAQRDRQAIDAEKAQLSVVGEVVAQIMSAKDENELAEITFDLWANREKLAWEAQKRRELADINAQKQALAPSPEARHREVEAQLGESIGGALAEAKTQPWAAGLKASDWTALTQAIEPIQGSFIVRAPSDMPDRGLRQGDLAFDADRFFAVLERQAGLLTAERKRAAEEKTRSAAATKAAAQNTAALVSSVKAPPSVASAEKPAPSGSAPTFTSKQEFDDWVIKGG